MSKIRAIQRKRPIYYETFPYKISFLWVGMWKERKQDIIKSLGYEPKMPAQRLTNSGFLYLSNKKDFKHIIKKYKSIIDQAFEPAPGYETMLKKDYKFLWHKRFPYSVKFHVYAYFKQDNQQNIIKDITKVDDWCEGNLLGPYQVTSSAVYVMTMSDATSIKLMFGKYIKEVVQKFTDIEIKKMLKQRCVEADDDLEYFENG